MFALFPALGWYGFLHIDIAEFPNPALFVNFASHLEDIRSGALRAIPLDDIRGIISFPSYHAALAVLAVWALWPVCFICWPLLMLNTLMIASTPIEGTHYFVDVIGGVAVSVHTLPAVDYVRCAIRRHCVYNAHGGLLAECVATVPD